MAALTAKGLFLFDDGFALFPPGVFASQMSQMAGCTPLSADLWVECEHSRPPETQPGKPAELLRLLSDWLLVFCGLHHGSVDAGNEEGRRSCENHWTQKTQNLSRRDLFCVSASTLISVMNSSTTEGGLQERY